MRTSTLVAVRNLRSQRETQCSHHAPRDERSSRGARRLHWRDGATVLEVIFSIGIVAVGLLGTLIIIPVAGNRVTQGTIADNADRAGRNAIRQFDVMQMGRQDMWTRYRTTPDPEQYLPFHPTVAEPAFCIDPLFISTHVYNQSNNGANVSIAVSRKIEFFPYLPPTSTSEARMRRVSLRRFPGAPHNLLLPNVVDYTSPPAVRFQMGMPLEQAYQGFMTQDDLVFDLPDDRTLVPEQKFDSNSAKRQFDGKYTWMVTLSPKGMSYSTSATFTNTDLYTLSFIVFHRRDMSMAFHYGDPTKEEPDPERLVYADFRWDPTAPDSPPDSTDPLAPGAGIGGGNVWFKTIQHDRNGNGNVNDDLHWSQDLEVRKGDWVMLSAKVVLGGTNAPVSVFRWYRVLSADEEVPGNAGAGFARAVTLLGPDWTDVIAAQGTSQATQATLLNGVVAVYEKTIHLETSGMWTDR